MAKHFRFNYNKLRGRIREKIGTEGEFCKQLGRSQNYLTNVFKGKTYFTADEISTIRVLLDIDKPEIPVYFFEEIVHEEEHFAS